MLIPKSKDRWYRESTQPNEYKDLLQNIDRITIPRIQTRIPLFETRTPSRTLSISQNSEYRFSNLWRFDSRIDSLDFITIVIVIIIQYRPYLKNLNTALQGINSNRVKLCSKFSFEFDFRTIRTPLVLIMVYVQYKICYVIHNKLFA